MPLEFKCHSCQNNLGPRTRIGYVKGKLMGYRAETTSELLVRIRVFLSEIPQKAFTAVFLEWMERLQKCMQADGEYVR
jgi:hypothetical protein